MKNKLLKKFFTCLIIIITILALIYTIIELINIYKKPENLLLSEDILYPEKDNINSLFSEDVNLKTLREKFNNNDIIARLEIPNVLNILLTQTDNNDFYLKYNIKREKNIKGNEFIDFRNSMFDKQINIYGHNSKYYDSPFKKIELFKKEDFFKDNEYILLQHSIGRRIYKIVSFKKVTNDYEHMIINSQNHKEHISKLLENSKYKRDIEYDDNTNILILQTCTTEGEKGYYLIVAFEIKDNEFALN